eukprot:TRINITY_DN6964_c0_g1_i1.p1 TRINITY_DN6964_c0_g1~~TRINITY_DN6964_c0_g1_i1.p1  ORF type:complete len:112 (-),score=26.79 TRINITY_DN6964_c0_g1_i1:273-608(-)
MIEFYARELMYSASVTGFSSTIILVNPPIDAVDDDIAPNLKNLSEYVDEPAENIMFCYGKGNSLLIYKIQDTTIWTFMKEDKNEDGTITGIKRCYYDFHDSETKEGGKWWL